MGRPLTDLRKQTFLEVLARTGSVGAAAAAATPWSTGAHGGTQTFRDERKRNVEFAAAWDRAVEHFLGKVEEEIVRRALDVPKRPVWERGQVKGWIEDRHSSDKLLLRLAAKLDPSWRERTAVEQTVTVEGVVFSISPQDVLLLAREEQETFVELMHKIADARGEDSDEVPELPAGSILSPATPGT